MMKLGVNVDHVATLRQARGTLYPDPVEAAGLCAEAGAAGVTIHLREDRRHIRDGDVYRMKELCPLPLNLEMANTPEIVDIALSVRPHEVCLVPEKRQELTTEGGLDVLKQEDALVESIEKLHAAGIRVSLFIDPAIEMVQTAARLHAPIIELHTGSYCDAPEDQKEEEVQALIAGAREAHRLGLQVNAGHGISVSNMQGILRIPHLDTLNIGHSIISRAVFVGMKNAVHEMLEAMMPYTGGER